MKYEEWLNEWLQLYVKPTVKRRTFERYRDIARIHIIPQLGECDLDDITSYHLQNHINYLLMRGNTKNGIGLSVNYVNSIITLIQASLKIANKTGYSKKFVGDSIRRPKGMEKEITCFSAEEQQKIEKLALNSKKEKLKGIIISLYTGLRIGELLALEWNDIDFSNGLITVNKTCYDSTEEGFRVRKTETPKTKSSRRIIPCPNKLLQLVQNMKNATDSKYVISDKGKPIYIRSYQRSFELLLKKAAIPHKGFHSLRHTFATRAIECGMDIKTLSEILGHKNATVTLNRYAHSMMAHKKEMMNKVGQLLK